MKLRRIVVTCIAVLFASGLSGMAWNSTGHKLVAAVAYSKLTADEQTQVDNILKSHPKYSEWTNSYKPGDGNVPLGLYVFMEASTWPDEIRNYNDPATHADWHFVDYPLRPASYRFRAAPAPEDDVVYGIKKCSQALADSDSSARSVAENLSFLVHFVGDAHQPLHCSSLFNQTFNTADGDRGGNYFYVKMKVDSANPVKLHSLWDSLVGTGADPENLRNNAEMFMTNHPQSEFSASALAKSPADWTRESRSLAVSAAYKPLPSLDGTKKHPVVLPEDYYANARKIAQKQVTLAGYRLAAEMHEILADRQNP